MATATHELATARFIHDFMKITLTIADLSRALPIVTAPKGGNLSAAYKLSLYEVSAELASATEEA